LHETSICHKAIQFCFEIMDRRRHGRQKHRRVEVFDTAGQLDAPWQTLISRVAPGLHQGHPLGPVSHARGGRHSPYQARHGATPNTVHLEVQKPHITDRVFWDRQRWRVFLPACQPAFV